MLLLLIYSVLGLPKNELPAGGVVAKVKPVQNPRIQYPLVDGTPSFARINTANHEIDLCVLRDLLYLCLHALPVQPPEKVDPMRQNDRFWKADFGSAKRLAHAVGFADRIGINQRHLQAARMAECQHGLVEVREAGSDGAAVPAAADHQDANRPFQQLRIESVLHRRSDSSLFRYCSSGSCSMSVVSGNRSSPARLFQSAVVPPRRFVRRPPPPGWVNSLWKNACCHAAIEVTVNDFGARIVPAHTAPLMLSTFQ